MISFIKNVHNRHIHEDRKKISSCQGLGRERIGSDYYGVSFRGDDNILELDSGDGCITLCIN